MNPSPSPWPTPIPTNPNPIIITMAPPGTAHYDDFDLDSLLLEQHHDLNLRSGSAPPTVAGSRANFLGPVAEEVTALPAYSSYYYNQNRNPRMPPPTLSREELRATERFGTSLFSVQPVGAERQQQRMSMQEEFGQPTYISGHQLHPAGQNASDNIVDPTRVSDQHLSQLENDIRTLENLNSGTMANGLVRVRSVGSTMSQSFASAQGSPIGRSTTTTPDPQLIRRSPSPRLHAVGGRVSDNEKKILSNGFGGLSSGMTEFGDISAHLSGLKLSDRITEHGQHQQNYTGHPDLLFDMPNDQRQYTPPYVINDAGLSIPASNGQMNMSRQIPANDIYRKAAVGSVARTNENYQTYNTDIPFAGRESNIYSANQGLSTMPNNRVQTDQYFSRSNNNMGSSFQLPVTESSYAQYLQRAGDYGAQLPASPGALGRNYLDLPYLDSPGYQEAYLGALLAQQKLLNGSPYLGRAGGFDNGIYGNAAVGRDLPYQNQLSGSLASSFGTGSSLRSTDRMPRFPSMLRGAFGGSKGSWNHENIINEENVASSLLEELKNNKTRSFELSEIVGHVVEFSGDQYGSRFIQQKLETASDEEKGSIFPEILPNARVLMTDVFGNYVIQKFFEYGTESQRNQLADALMGYVLPLSLQMYGCRVIQKALEVVDVERQTRMVTELDGSVMKCVRDQNGNHVVQKCIECVPQEKIQFIISCFYGQVIPLSTHPYGCRVIQRVLEHCDDAQTQSLMMEEILQSVCTLAQDQYGNYVIQHVLQHGKQEERACIINKLAGQIVKMSQQKFASNVVEKCLAYSTPEERELIIEEMLGTTDENEPLQAMMKDQFGNYVVQKVLESCDDKKLELIISRIKVHLSVLKKYTYGKHIVARVEKLITTGERRIGMSANST